METGTKTNPTVIAIFGGTGDLTWRKLIPALYNLYLDDWLNPSFLIICIGRQEMTNQAFAKRLKDGVDKFSRRGKSKKASWDAFAKKIEYKKGDFDSNTVYSSLKKQIDTFEKDAKCPVNKIYYMAVPPQFFELIAVKIG